MLWSWYLANDTQFYIIGAIILIIAVRHFRIAATILVSFLISSWVTTGVIAYNNNHIPNTDDPLALFDMIYDKPWTRIGPYMIGMSVGWILFKTDCKVKLSKTMVALGWSMSMSIGLYLIYGLYNTTLDQLGGAAYSSLSHSAWALSMAWIIFACSTGYGGWVNRVLASPLTYPFSRTTYCAYLVHPIAIRIMALNSTAPMHLGKYLMVMKSLIDSLIIIISEPQLTPTCLSLLHTGYLLLRTNGQFLCTSIYRVGHVRSARRHHAQDFISQPEEAGLGAMERRSISPPPRKFCTCIIRLVCYLLFVNKSCYNLNKFAGFLFFWFTIKWRDFYLFFTIA